MRLVKPVNFRGSKKLTVQYAQTAQGLGYKEAPVSAYLKDHYVSLSPRLERTEEPDVFDSENTKYVDTAGNQANEVVEQIDILGVEFDLDAVKAFHPKLVALDFETLAENMKEDIRIALGFSEKTTNQLLMVFARASNLEDWIGVIGYGGDIDFSDSEVNLFLDLKTVFVKPLYQRKSFAPVMCGIAGYIIGGCVLDDVVDRVHINREPKIPPYRTCDVMMGVRSSLAMYVYLYRSFALGVDYLMRLTGSVEIRNEYPDEAVVAATIPNMDYGFDIEELPNS